MLDYDDPLPPPPPAPAALPPVTSPPPPADAGDGAGDMDADSDYVFTESTCISLHRSPAPPPPPPHHAATLARFVALRTRLSTASAVPSRDAPQLPRPAHDRQWRDLASTTPPSIQSLRTMGPWGLLRLVQAFRNWLRWRLRVNNASRRGVPRLWGAWIWAVLALLDDRCLGADDVSALRELGKCALEAWRMLGLDGRWDADRDGNGVGGDWAEEGEGEGDGGLDDCGGGEGEADAKKTEAADKQRGQAEQGEAEEEELEEGEERASARPPGVQSQGPELSIEFYNHEDTRGMMDMIVSVIGDFFGQRDLLHERAGLT